MDAGFLEYINAKHPCQKLIKNQMIVSSKGSNRDYNPQQPRNLAKFENPELKIAEVAEHISNPYKSYDAAYDSAIVDFT